LTVYPHEGTVGSLESEEHEMSQTNQTITFPAGQAVLTRSCTAWPCILVTGEWVGNVSKSAEVYALRLRERFEAGAQVNILKLDTVRRRAAIESEGKYAWVDTNQLRFQEEVAP